MGKCICSACGSTYICNVYDAKRSRIGHLCSSCKNKIIDLKNPTSADLNQIYNYDACTGALTFAIDAFAAKKDTLATKNHIQGYLHVRIGKKYYLAHRVIWCMIHGDWPDQIDHINHNRKDNRLINLRNVSARSNQLNISLKRNNSSGINGVRKLPSGNFCAYIMVNRKQISLGTYLTLEEAKAARKQADKQYGFHVNHGT